MLRAPKYIPCMCVLPVCCQNTCTCIPIFRTDVNIIENESCFLKCVGFKRYMITGNKLLV